jgi:hypothetical protein
LLAGEDEGRAGGGRMIITPAARRIDQAALTRRVEPDRRGRRARARAGVVPDASRNALI